MTLRNPPADGSGNNIKPDEETEIMTALRVAGFDAKTIRNLSYSTWKDGIDIERPTVQLIAFARLIRAGLVR